MYFSDKPLMGWYPTACGIRKNKTGNCASGVWHSVVSSWTADIAKLLIKFTNT